MAKQKSQVWWKVLLGIALVVIVGVIAVFASQSELFQGRLGRPSKTVDVSLSNLVQSQTITDLDSAKNVGLIALDIQNNTNKDAFLTNMNLFCKDHNTNSTVDCSNFVNPVGLASIEGAIVTSFLTSGLSGQFVEFSNFEYLIIPRGEVRTVYVNASINPTLNDVAFSLNIENNGIIMNNTSGKRVNTTMCGSAGICNGPLITVKREVIEEPIPEEPILEEEQPVLVEEEPIIEEPIREEERPAPEEEPVPVEQVTTWVTYGWNVGFNSQGENIIVGDNNVPLTKVRIYNYENYPIYLRNLSLEKTTNSTAPLSSISNFKLYSRTFNDSTRAFDHIDTNAVVAISPGIVSLDFRNLLTTNPQIVEILPNHSKDFDLHGDVVNGAGLTISFDSSGGFSISDEKNNPVIVEPFVNRVVPAERNIILAESAILPISLEITPIQIGDQGVTVNEQQALLGAFDLTTIGGQVRVFGIMFTCNPASSGLTDDCHDYLHNIMLYPTEHFVPTDPLYQPPLDGPEVLINNRVFFVPNDVINEGETKTYYIRGDITSSAVVGDSLALDIAFKTDVTAEDIDGNTLTSSQIQLCNGDNCTYADGETPEITISVPTEEEAVAPEVSEDDSQPILSRTASSPSGSGTTALDETLVEFDVEVTGSGFGDVYELWYSFPLDCNGKIEPASVKLWREEITAGGGLLGASTTYVHVASDTNGNNKIEVLGIDGEWLISENDRQLLTGLEGAVLGKSRVKYKLTADTTVCQAGDQVQVMIDGFKYNNNGILESACGEANGCIEGVIVFLYNNYNNYSVTPNPLVGNVLQYQAL